MQAKKWGKFSRSFSGPEKGRGTAFRPPPFFGPMHPGPEWPGQGLGVRPFEATGEAAKVLGSD